MFAFLCLAILPASAFAQNYSDIWWNPGESGWGLTIADHGSQLFGVWFTYREDGRPTWFVIPGGTFSADRKQFHGDIYATTGPSYAAPTFDPSRFAVRVVGTAAIDFAPPGLASGTALFSYSLAGINHTRQIERQPFGNAVPAWGADVTDIWWNPSESGWGLTLAQHGNNVFGVWFTYDTDGQPLWAVMPGVTFNGADSFAGALYTTTGPYFGIAPFDPSKVTVTPQGSATVTVSHAVASANPQCAGGQSATFDPVFRGNTARRSICPQAFGDSPGGSPATLTTADLAPPGLAARPGPRSAAVPAIVLLESDLPELAAYEGDASGAEQFARDALAAQIARLPAIAKGDEVPKPAKGAAIDGANWGGLGVVAGNQLNQWYGKRTEGTLTASHTSGGTSVTAQAGGGTAADGTVSGTTGLVVKADGASGSLDTEVLLKAEGKMCPGPDGNLAFKFSVVAGSQGVVGSKRAGFREELEVSGTLRVNSAAYVENVDFAIRVQSSAQRPDSHNAFVDGTYKGSLVGQWTDNYQLAIPSLSVNVTRMGSTTTPAEGADMLNAGRKHAIATLQGYIELLQLNWRDGTCVEVIAPVAATVAPGSSTSIQARVRHKLEGADLALPVDSDLSGAASLSPPRIAAAPGTFVYVAPETRGSIANLTFTSTSRRGIGKASAAVRTAGSTGYLVDWSQGGTRVWGAICNGLESGFSLNFDRAARSPGRSGSVRPAAVAERCTWRDTSPEHPSPMRETARTPSAAARRSSCRFRCRGPRFPRRAAERRRFPFPARAAPCRCKPRTIAPDSTGAPRRHQV